MSAKIQIVFLILALTPSGVQADPKDTPKSPCPVVFAFLVDSLPHRFLRAAVGEYLESSPKERRAMKPILLDLIRDHGQNGEKFAELLETYDQYHNELRKLLQDKIHPSFDPADSTFRHIWSDFEFGGDPFDIHQLEKIGRRIHEQSSSFDFLRTLPKEQSILGFERERDGLTYSAHLIYQNVFPSLVARANPSLLDALADPATSTLQHLSFLGVPGVQKNGKSYIQEVFDKAPNLGVRLRSLTIRSDLNVEPRLLFSHIPMTTYSGEITTFESIDFALSSPRQTLNQIQKAPVFAKLRNLRIADAEIRSEHLIDIIAHPIVEKLSILDLSNTSASQLQDPYFGPKFNRFTPAGIRSLITSPALRRTKPLVISLQKTMTRDECNQLPEIIMGIDHDQLPSSEVTFIFQGGYLHGILRQFEGNPTWKITRMGHDTFAIQRKK